VLACYQSLLRQKLRREPAFVWGALVACCSDLYPAEGYADIQQAYAEELVDEAIIGLDDVEATLALDKETVLKRLQHRHYQLITDAIGEFEQWAGFQPPPAPPRGLGHITQNAPKKQKQKTKHKRKMAKASRRKNRR
jgi:hypothetical protein